MRVLALGAAGEYGRPAARVLASNSLVSEIVIAGRNLEAAQTCAKDVGEKARAVSVDVSDRDKLVTLAKDFDIIVNTAGPEYEVVLKALDAAIAAGTNYCDIGADGATTEKALELDSAAKAKGVTALLGIGACPGLCTLMMMHAARQLDRVEELRSCGFFQVAAFGFTKDVVRGYREAKRLSASVPMLMKWGTPPFFAYRDGKLVTVKDKAEEARITLPGNGEILALLAGGPEPLTIPRSLPEVKNVHMLISWFPSRLNGIYRELGEQVVRGELNLTQAALDFLDQAVAEQDRGQPAPSGLPMVMRWAEAVGTKDGKRTRYSCWPTPGWFKPNPTPVAMALAALKILGDEISTHGVLTPEVCLDPLPFFKDVARQQLKIDEPGKLLNEAWQTL